MTRILMTALISAFVWAGAASAQTEVPGGSGALGIGTSAPGGLIHTVGSAVARVVTEKGGVRAVVVPQGAPGPEPVHNGTLPFSINNAFDVSFSVTAGGYRQGQTKLSNIRMVSVLMPTLVAMYVRKDSDIRELKDLKNKRVPGGFNAQPTIEQVYMAYLQNGGLTYKDVRIVPAQNILKGSQDFEGGKADAFMYSLGTGRVMEVAASVSGGVRALSMTDTADAKARLNASLPGAYMTAVPQAKFASQLALPTTNVITYDLVLFCNPNVPEDTIYKIVKALHDNKQDLIDTYQPMEGFEQKRMGTTVPGVEYHPGAIKFYKEKGILAQS